MELGSKLTSKAVNNSNNTARVLVQALWLGAIYSHKGVHQWEASGDEEAD